jgi:hypothetical protein
MTLRDQAIYSYLDQIQPNSCHLAVYSDVTYIRVVTDVFHNAIDGVDQFGCHWGYDRRTSGRWDCTALTLTPLASIEEAKTLYPELFI